MPVPLIHFPFSAVVDGIISYIQYVFGNPELTPATYRWNSNSRATRIQIKAPFVIDNEKKMSAPFIVVERGTYVFQNRTLDNLKSADPNTFHHPKFSDIADGYVNIICGSGVAGEASSIANFLAIIMQANRHRIAAELKFIRDLHYIDCGPEIPIVKDTEVRRWEVTLRFAASIQLNWFKLFHDPEPELFNKASVFGLDDESIVDSDKGITSIGLDTLVDSTQDFGYLLTNDPQLLQQDLERGWYYIRFKDNEYKQLYPIVEIVNSTTLRLQTHDTDGNPVAWSAPESAIDVEYELLWNGIHLHVELPLNT